MVLDVGQVVEDGHVIGVVGSSHVDADVSDVLRADASDPAAVVPGDGLKPAKKWVVMVTLLDLYLRPISSFTHLVPQG